MLNVGNVISDSYYQIPDVPIPGELFTSWTGTAIISQPANQWDVLDINGQPLPILPNTKVHLVAFEILDDLFGTAGDALKLGGSVADTNTYVASTAVIPAGGILVDQKLIVKPAVPYVVPNPGFTFKLWLHTGNAAPGTRTLQSLSQSPSAPSAPFPVRPKPTRINIQVIWSIVKTDLPNDIGLCKQHQRLLSGLQ